MVQGKLLDAVTRSGLLTWSRKRALLGLSFGLAESCVGAKSLGQAMSMWNRGCTRQQTPLHLRIAGLLMLYAVRRGSRPNGVCSRLVNKWKGWARFRQEPLLLEHAEESSPKTSNDCAA